MLASFGAIAGLRISGAIDETTGFLLLAVAMTLLIPFVRTVLARQRESGFVSGAIVRYNKRFLAASLGYCVGLGLAVTIHHRVDLGTGETFLIALLPVIPIFAMIWAMARYLVEESDEYLRQRAVMASLFGLGLVLAAGSFWGFLETFEVVPHVEAWWTFPVWAIGMGAGQCWMALRDRSEDTA